MAKYRLKCLRTTEIPKKLSENREKTDKKVQKS